MHRDDAESDVSQIDDDDGGLVTGAAWASSDNDVVSLSTADSPVLTAVAPGTVTISVGSASADVTVYAGPSLPLGTVIWTNGASTAVGLYPAVPNYDAVADVFAMGANNEVTAITGDGTTAWTYQGLGGAWLFPDFQGGVVAYETGESLWRLDPLTGAPLPLFSYTTSEGQQNGYAEPRIHPDGTVFTTDYACTSTDCSGGTDGETRTWIVGIDGKTAATKFRAPLQNSTAVTTITPADELFCQATGGTWTGHAWPASWAAIIAGDGRYYVSYTTDQGIGTVQRTAAQVHADAAYALWDQLLAHVVDSEFGAARAAHDALRAATGESYTWWDSQLDAALDAGTPASRVTALSLLNQQTLKYKRLCDVSWSSVMALHVMQVGPDGSSSDVVVKTWERMETSAYILASGPEAPWGYRPTKTYTGHQVSLEELNFITDADQGALVSWLALELCGTGAPGVLVLVDTCVQGTDHHLTLLRNGALASDVVWGQTGIHAVRPDLQLEDGSFVGTQFDASYNHSTLVFSATGTTKWSLPGYGPLVATEGEGLIATTGIAAYIVNGAGSITGMLSQVPDVRSWRGFSYDDGLVSRLVSADNITLAPTFAAVPQGNASRNGTAIQQVLTREPQELVEQVPEAGATLLTNYSAIELVTNETVAELFHDYVETFDGVKTSTNSVAYVISGTPVTGTCQVLTFALQGRLFPMVQGPFSVATTDFDTGQSKISVVTLKGHPLAGWRYRRVFSPENRHVVIETGALDRNAPGPMNWVGYWVIPAGQLEVWQRNLEFILSDLQRKGVAQLGNNPLHNVVNPDNSRTMLV